MKVVVHQMGDGRSGSDNVGFVAWCRKWTAGNRDCCSSWKWQYGWCLYIASDDSGVIIIRVNNQFGLGLETVQRPLDVWARS